MPYCLKLASSTITGIAMTFSVALAQSTNPAWLDEVTVQLALEEQCNVGYFISMKETELAGQLYFEARAQCEDGRQFDAVREGRIKPFKITKCKETVVC